MIFAINQFQGMLSLEKNSEKKTAFFQKINLIYWLVGFHGISTFVGYLFLCK